MNMAIVLRCKPLSYLFAGFTGLRISFDLYKGGCAVCVSSRLIQQTFERQIRGLRKWQGESNNLDIRSRTWSQRKLVQQIKFFVASIAMFIFRSFTRWNDGKQMQNISREQHANYERPRFSTVCWVTPKIIENDINQFEKPPVHHSSFVENYESSLAK